MKFKTPNRYRFLYLIRHGQHQRSEQRLGGRLTELGVAQAATVAAAMSKIPISKIHCSDMPRALQTAEIIQAKAFPDLALRPTRLLRERVFVAPGLKQLAHLDPKEIAGPAVLERLDRRYLRLARSETHEIIVCHGNLIRALMTHVLGAELGTTWHRAIIQNASITRLVVWKKHDTRLLSFNEAGHLPAEMQTLM